MEINIKLMTEEAYVTLQKNYKDVFEQIKMHPSDCTWLGEYLGFEPFESKKYTIEDFNLLDSENYEEVMQDNSITLYEHLSALPRYILCNNRFWAWITFEKAYKQAQHSMPLKSDNLIKSWWLGNNARRSLMLGVISRYYFRAEISVDNDRENKYELTEYLNKAGEVYRNLTYRNIGMLPSVSHAVIMVSRDISEKYEIVANKAIVREILKQTSRLGSVMLIDDLSTTEIYDYLLRKIEKWLFQQGIISF